MARRIEDAGDEADVRPLWQRLAWLVGFWIAGVASLGLVAWLLKMAMRGAGLST
ncbi:DUF2474 domain-containing protein [Ramlibacter sp.]|uniref:DUF2474 domain-containing protein n=1 Tax=Ramlibacter sp. TaxID=1917967 RepID=UPI003D120520